MDGCYTQEEASKLLGFSREYLISQMFTSGPHPLYPSVNFTESVSMKRFCTLDESELTLRRGLVPESKTGLFTLFLFDVSIDECLASGRLSLYHANSLSFAKLPYELAEIKAVGEFQGLADYYAEEDDYIRRCGIKRFITLEQEGSDYLLDQPVSIPLADLLISRETLENYARFHGINLVSSELAKQLQQQETPEKLIERLRLEGQSNEEIAQKLKITFPTFTPHRIGKLITEIPGRIVTADAYRKRGIRLLK